jgi:aromatic ring-opening dioxygenase LigB subunit
VCRYVDADLSHRFDSEGVYGCRQSAAAGYFEAITRNVSQQTLGHLAPGGVARAKEKHSRFHALHLPDP